MTPRKLALAAALGLGLALVGQRCAAADLRPDTLEVGQVGAWRASAGELFAFRVREVVNDSEMVVYLPGSRDNPVYIAGRSTKGIADGREVELPGEWKVTGTRKHRGRTYYVAEPVAVKK